LGVTLWFFAEGVNGSMSRIPAARVQAFWKGRSSLQASAPGEMRMVQVGLLVEEREVVQFIAAWYSRCRLAADGTLDEEHRIDAMRLAVAGIDWTGGDDQVVDLGPRIAKREYETEHAWRPRNEQLQQGDPSAKVGGPVAGIG
jgi:hypothetical protein